MIRKQKVLATFLAAGLSMVITSQAETVYQANNRLRSFADGVPSIKLGYGYASLDKMAVLQTPLSSVQTLPVTYSDIQSDLYMSNTIDRSDLAKTLNVDASASGGWGMFSASASASYMHSTEDTNYAENFTYLERFFANASIDVSQLPMGIGALSPSAQTAYQQSLSAFTNRYGDAFVGQAPEGALLAINLQLNFNSSVDKENFDAAISGGFGSIFNASASMQEAVNASHAQGSLIISAYQLGGDPTQLTQIFTKQSGGNYYFSSCGLDDLQACQATLAGIVDYAKNKFSQQISISGNQPQGNLVIVGQPVTETYASAFGLQSIPALMPETLSARLQLAELYQATARDKDLVDHILASSVATNLTPDASNNLKAMQQALTWNESLFDTFNAMTCYTLGEEGGCSNVLQQIQQSSKPIDQNIIGPFQSGYRLSSTVSGWVSYWSYIGGNQYARIKQIPLPTPSTAMMSLLFSADKTSVQINQQVYEGTTAINCTGTLYLDQSGSSYSGSINCPGHWSDSYVLQGIGYNPA